MVLMLMKNVSGDDEQCGEGRKEGDETMDVASGKGWKKLFETPEVNKRKGLSRGFGQGRREKEKKIS